MSPKPFPIAFDPDEPVSGSKLESHSAEMNGVVAAKSAAFRRVYLPYPPHTHIHRRCDYLIQLGRATRGYPQQGFRVLAPSGSGKSAVALAYKAIVELEKPATETCKPIIYVMLESDTTTKRLMISILKKFGDKHAERGTEIELKSRVLLAFERFGTVLLIIDEVQHLRRSGGANVTDVLKRFLDDGVVPILFLGTDDAGPMLDGNIQFSSRLLEPCDLTPLDRNSSEDRALLRQFVKSLDLQLVADGLIAQPAGLDHSWILGCLHEISAGVIGRISRLLLIALESALRRGASCIEVYDLALATDRWAIPNTAATRNPFRLTAPRSS